MFHVSFRHGNPAQSRSTTRLKSWIGDAVLHICIRAYLIMFVYELFDSRVSGRDHLHLHIFITFILFWQMEAHLGIAQSLGLAK